MSARILEICARYGAPAGMAEELAAAFASHQAAELVTARIEGYEPIQVDQPPSDDGLFSDLDTLEPPAIAGRYSDLGPIGIGGMGTVRRVHDAELNRTLAMKVLHTKLIDSPGAVARFVEEAQATAQLQHPSIVPIHDLGCLPDGRIWFTMREVQGRTLSDVTTEVHEASTWRWNRGATGWTFKRVMAAFLQVCRAVAYAHERSVVHRDLKPENIMVGRHGETYVLDWGIAKVLGRELRTGDSLSETTMRQLLTGEGPVVSRLADELRTRFGSVAGTPAYMAPEQARGNPDLIDARTDVYALGAILYKILSGRTPYTGMNAILEVLEGPPPPLREDRPLTLTWSPTGNRSRLGPPLADELVAACERAMARDPSRRFPSALDLADEVEAWLDGARKREQAVEITERALQRVDDANGLLQQADALQSEGDALLEHVERWRPEEHKAPGWDRQDRAAALRREALLEELAVDQALHGALQVAPDLPEAHGALAERYRLRHEKAERERDGEGAALAETRVRTHAEALPVSSPTGQACEIYLKGDGTLDLLTEPPGAEVLLYRYQPHHRRLLEVPVQSLGETPLREVPLPMGSYLCLLKHPGCALVRYPIEVTRLGHWTTTAPGDRQPTPVWLPPEGFLGPDEVYVPAGWFWSGRDPHIPYGHPDQRLWCDALVVQRFPVTNRQYLAFLDDLVAQGRPEEALRHAPRERPGTADEEGALIYGFDGSRFSLQADADGDSWLPDYPVLQVDLFGAQAYLAWWAAKTGRPWRLPGELEWEKAARGVDARSYPWGDRFDESWCCMTDSHRGPELPSVVDSYPVDVSPYGVRGMAGNVRDWCLDLHGAAASVTDDRVVVPPEVVDPSDRRPRVARGGSWGGNGRLARIANRGRYAPTYRYSSLGFRGVYRPSDQEEEGGEEGGQDVAR